MKKLLFIISLLLYAGGIKAHPPALYITPINNVLSIAHSVDKALIVLQCEPDEYSKGYISVHINTITYIADLTFITFNNTPVNLIPLNSQSEKFSYKFIEQGSVDTLTKVNNGTLGLDSTTVTGRFIYTLSFANKDNPVNISVGNNVYTFSTLNYQVRVFTEYCRYESKSLEIDRLYNYKLDLLTHL